CGFFYANNLSAYTSLRQNTSLSVGQEELGFILPTSASSRKPYVRLRLLVTLRSRLPRRKGAKKIIQVVPSLRGLQTRGTALSFAPSKTICCSCRSLRVFSSAKRGLSN